MRRWPSWRLGTLTSQARNKRGNRKCEFLLRDAEFLHALADIVSPTLNTRVPSPERAVYDVSGLDLEDEGDPIVALDRAWKLLLLNQFHDIIPGSSIHWVYEDSDRDYATIASLGTSVRDAALEEVNELIDTSAYSEPVIVFNTLGHRRQEVVDLPGATEPALVDVPPLGYTIIEKHQKAPANEVGVKVAKEGADFVLDNGIVRVRVNAKGQLTSLFDHRTGREAVPAGEVSNVLKLHIDRPNLWEAWDVDIFYRETACVLDDVRSLKIVESHPLRAAIEVERAFGKSTLRQRIVVCAGSPRVDFPMQVEWHETRRFMRAYFPMAVRSQRATYEIQFGHLERPTHSNTSWDMARFEVCAQKWADLSESGFGVALLNDCKYGHDAVGHVLGLSLLRSPIAPDPVADQGHQEFTYSLLPHAGDFRAAGVIEHAYALNVPLIREPVGVHPGMLPPAHAFVHVEGAGIVVETIKPAQDGNGTIVRFYESRGGRGSGKLLFGLPYRTAVWVDLMEKEISAARHEGDAVHFTFSPFEILTLRVA